VERAGERYRGTQAIGVVVPGQQEPRELVIVALDRWENAVILRGTATVDRDDPFWLPGTWELTSDAGTEHRGGGGGTSIGWLEQFEPPLPPSARALRVRLGPDNERFGPRKALDDSRVVDVALPAEPPTIQRAPATFDPAAEPGVFTGRRPSLEGASVRPDAIVAVSAQLDDPGDPDDPDDLAGRDVAVTSIERFPAWFLLHLAGTGGLVVKATTADRRPPGRFGKLWTAEDDRGNRYEGALRSSHSGFPWLVTAGLTPALDPAATELVLAFPNLFGPGIVRTRFALPPGQPVR